MAEEGENGRIIFMAIDEHDEVITRCPKMGDFVPFFFCRKAGTPFCQTIIFCWAPRLDIGQFLADHYSPEQIQESLKSSSAGRIGRMVELAGRWRRKPSAQGGEG